MNAWPFVRHQGCYLCGVPYLFDNIDSCLSALFGTDRSPLYVRTRAYTLFGPPGRMYRLVLSIGLIILNWEKHLESADRKQEFINNCGVANIYTCEATPRNVHRTVLPRNYGDVISVGLSQDKGRSCYFNRPSPAVFGFHPSTANSEDHRVKSGLHTKPSAQLNQNRSRTPTSTHDIS